MTAGKRMVICGSRWVTPERVAALLSEVEAVGMFDTVTHIATGGARGADEAAHAWVGENLAVHREVFPADWEGFGKAAGPLRNRGMVTWLLGAEYAAVVALWDGTSRGTADMVSQACAAGIPVMALPVKERPVSR